MKSFFLNFKFFFLAVLFIAVIVSYLAYKQYDEEEYIGWVSDIHADRFKKRNVESGLLYPKQYKIYFPKVLEELRRGGIKTVVTTGDNTNSGDDNYARDIEKISKGMEMIWAKGNHDNDEVMEILGVEESAYYFHDLTNVRIIVLDTTEYINDEYDYFGGISDKQLDWIASALKTEKAVIVAMHMPMFQGGSLIERYEKLEKILSSNGNVKLVLAGHYHFDWQTEKSGINYYILKALTKDGEKGSYARISLKDFSVEYLKAE